MRPLRIGLLVAMALAVAGCGATKESSTPPSGAEFAPASSVVYVTGVTDPSSSQWEKAENLLDRFPGREQLLASARRDLRKDGLTWEQDVKPALGEDLNLVLLSYKDPDHNYVFFTKPRDEAKFDKLLESGGTEDRQVHRKIEGWTVFADNEKALDNFEAAHSAGNPLSEDDTFRDAMKGLPDDAALRGYVAGEPIYALLEKEAAKNPDARSFENFSRSLGRLTSISFSASAEDEGVGVQAAFEQTKEAKLGNYSPELDDSLPGGALLYVSFGDLGDFFDEALKNAGQEYPELQQKLEQVQQALGFSLKDDVFPLLSKEGAIAVYKGADTPNALFALRVPDEDKANRLIDRLAGVAGLGGLTVRPFTVQGAEGKSFVLPGEAVTIYAVVADGKALVSNSRATLDQVLGDADKLSDDSVYKDARDAASAPDETGGFIYVNLEAALPYVFNVAAGDVPDAVTPEVRANTKPLKSTLLYTKRDGNRTTISGFLTIK